MSAIHPPLDCSLDVGEIIDHHIIHNNRSGAAYSFGDEAGHITDITHFEIARAAHRVAHILRPHRRGAESQVVAILAVTDVLVYQTIVAGCIKAGLVPFLISHRNSEAVIVHLLKSTKAHRVLTTKGSLGHLVDTVVADLSAVNPPYELTVEEIPLLGQIYPHLGHETTEHEFTPFPSPAPRIPLDNVTMYLHSSGSTGMPKCIPETQRNLIHFAALGCLAQIIEISPRQAHGVLPPFHTGAMLLQLVSPLLNGGTCCIFSPASTATEYRVPPTPTADNALEYAKRASATGITVAPAFLVDWEASEHVAYLKSLKLVAYAGGPLPTRVGDALYSQRVNIVPLYGGTEFGPPPDIRKTKADEDAGEWQWFRFSPRTNIRWMPEGDGIFELQFLTVPETHQLAIENLPDVKGYSTKDLFERHPTKPDMYRIVGRLDDVLIMANGEKTVPGPMEDEIMASPMINTAIMFGHEHSEVGVLVDPNPAYKVDSNDEEQLAHFRNLIWPVIERANENAPAFAQIYKEMILLMQPEKPIVRTGKGTINKKGTVATYKPEIDNLYETIEASGNGASDIEPPSSWASSDLKPWLRAHIALVTGHEISDGHDIFDQGFDSLNATFLRHRIVAALRRSADDRVKAASRMVPQNFVYAHPSITELAVAITALVSPDSDIADSGRPARIVESMIAKYGQGFGNPVVREFSKAIGGLVVLLTGSTGTLGSHILEVLLGLPSVDQVYAFNRKGKASALDRQRATFVDCALNINVLSSSKLVYLEGDTSTANLGLPVDVWSTLRDTVTVIIHNAWSLDFNKSLSSFEPHVKGTRNLIDLALQSPHKSGVRFLFTSSIGSAQGWDLKRGPFPEDVQFEASVAVGNGYGESKYVSERILAASGLEATSFRIGQVCGSARNGSWATTEWVPTIVKSSIALGNFPSDPVGMMAWLSPEAVSHTIVDAATCTTKLPLAVNLVNPCPVPWDRIMSALASEAQLPLIPLPDWVQQVQVRSSAATAEDVEKIPAIKLLEFFKTVVAGAGSIEFSTSKAQAMSEGMKSLKPLTEEDARQWMKYWRQKEFVA
ncbi:putative aminoadipate reductase [Mycena polygramma]|nr:putative aminoadipate reductase [Mycena polygramma]